MDRRLLHLDEINAALLRLRQDLSDIRDLARKVDDIGVRERIEDAERRFRQALDNLLDEYVVIEVGNRPS